MFNFIWFDELFPNCFLTCENLATHSILTTKKYLYVSKTGKTRLMSRNAKRSTKATISKDLYRLISGELINFQADRKKIDERDDHRSKFSNLSSWKEEACKKSGPQQDSSS